jgi:hypothetical protein
MALQTVVGGRDQANDRDHPDDETNLSNEHDHDHDDQDLDTAFEDDNEQPPSSLNNDNDLSAHDHAVDAFLRPLKPSDATLYRLACSFSDVYRTLALTSDQQFLPTPVTSLPSGQETGRYLAIDVGGSNLRVAFIELLGDSADETSDNGRNNSSGGATAGIGGGADGSARSRDTIRKAQRQRVRRTLEKTWPIGEHLKMDKAEDLFAWIGDCIAEVVADSLTADVARDTIPKEVEMGITFSFPMMYVLSLFIPYCYIPMPFSPWEFDITC